MNLEKLERIDPFNYSFDGLYCMLCGYKPNDQIFGDFYVNREIKISIHQHCMYFSSAVVQEEDTSIGFLGFSFNSLKKEINRGKRFKCNICKYKHATIGCCVSSCKIVVHYPCALKNRFYFRYFDDFSMKCHQHRPIFPVLTNKISIRNCPICFDHLDESDRTQSIPLPCCKTSACHFDCLQLQAINSGYFYRCPLCSNKSIFIKTMKEYGIYVPDRDVTWEEFLPNPNQSNDHLDQDETVDIENTPHYNHMINNQFEIEKTLTNSSKIENESLEQFTSVQNGFISSNFKTRFKSIENNSISDDPPMMELENTSSVVSVSIKDEIQATVKHDRNVDESPFSMFSSNSNDNKDPAAAAATTTSIKKCILEQSTQYMIDMSNTSDNYIDIKQRTSSNSSSNDVNPRIPPYTNNNIHTTLVFDGNSIFTSSLCSDLQRINKRKNTQPVRINSNIIKNSFYSFKACNNDSSSKMAGNSDIIILSDRESDEDDDVTIIPLPNDHTNKNFKRSNPIGFKEKHKDLPIHIIDFSDDENSHLNSNKKMNKKVYSSYSNNSKNYSNSSNKNVFYNATIIN